MLKGLANETDSNRSALCFIREIDNLEENLQDSALSRFIDVTQNADGQVVVDKEAKQLLEELKYIKVPAKLNENTNIFKLNVKWKNNGIDENQLTGYLENFGNLFYNEIKRLIDEAMMHEKEKEKAVFETYSKFGLLDVNDNVDSDMLIAEFKELIVELGLHAKEYNETISKFLGRDDLLAKIKEYLLCENKLPFVVTGVSGCGKTNVMALAHSNVNFKLKIK